MRSTRIMLDLRKLLEGRWRRLLPSIPVLLLLGLAALNAFRVLAHGATPWSSGGFGMHATYDSPLFRFVRVYGVDAAGEEHRIEIEQPSAFDVTLNRPSSSAFRSFLRESLRAGHQSADRYATYRIELWQFEYSGDRPALDTRLVAEKVLELDR